MDLMANMASDDGSNVTKNELSDKFATIHKLYVLMDDFDNYKDEEEHYTELEALMNNSN